MSNTETTPDQHIENMFFTLLGDAIEPVLVLPGLNAPGTRLRFTRISILASALVIEAAANSVFTRISFPPAVLKKIERNLSTFDKFDMFSLALFNQSRFDRGRLAAQRIDDLLAVRNEYVHPKLLARPAVHKNEAKKEITFHCGVYDYLKIDRSPRAWSSDQALTVLRAMDEFLTYYFLDHGGLTAAQATGYLIPRTFIDGVQVQASIDLEADLLYVNKARSELGIPFQFVDDATVRGT